MMRQTEFKKKYDPITGKFSKQHIYGKGITDRFRSILKGKKTTTTPPPARPPGKASKKAGDSIVKMLTKNNEPKKVTFKNQADKKRPTNSQHGINNKVLQILSGGKIM